MCVCVYAGVFDCLCSSIYIILFLHATCVDIHTYSSRWNNWTVCMCVCVYVSACSCCMSVLYCTVCMCMYVYWCVQVKFQRKQLLLLHSSDTVTDLEDYSDTVSWLCEHASLVLTTGIRTYIHTYIHTYIRTCQRASAHAFSYICTYVFCSSAVVLFSL